MIRKRIIGAALDSVTLSTVAVLVTIALAGMVDPSVAGEVVPLMVGVFLVTVTSGTAKIALNRKFGNGRNSR